MKKKIYVAGHNGLVGSAIVRLLKKKKVKIITSDRKKIDLTNQNDVKKFLKKEKPDQIYIAAAKAGGIYANSIYPADFIYDNVMIEANIIHQAFLNGIKKILFLGSSCIYPKFQSRPIKENKLLTGPLEVTNEPYALAKITGIKLCESYNRQYGKKFGIDYRSVMPSNLYGVSDNYNLQNSHVIPALIRKFYEAKINNNPKVIVWGSGKPKREFLYIDDLAKACYFLMNTKKEKFYAGVNPMCSHINVGSGYDLTIKRLAENIKKIVGFKGTIEFDKNKPDGVKKKLLDNTRIRKLGWKPRISLKRGLKKTFQDYKKKYGYS
jgi:GDP-L-fucose synthase